MALHGATASQTSASIAPDSTEYGDRQTLEAGLGAAVGGATQLPATSPATPSSPAGSIGDPMAALLGGLDPGAGPGPLTTGLSVGAGAGPLGEQQQQSPVQVKLQSLATSARSPMTRAAARNELRRVNREAV